MILDRCFTEKPKEGLNIKEESKKPWESSGGSTIKLQDCVYAEVADFEQFLNGIKRRMFFETLKSIYRFHKHAWAKLTVQ